MWNRWRELILDKITRAIIVIDYAHYKIHERCSFSVHDIQSVSTTTMQWMVTTPNTTKYSHMIFDFECTGEMQLIILEGADRIGTNLLTSVNRCRISPIKSAETVVHRIISGGSTDGADTMEGIRSGATGVASKTISGGGSRSLNELQLAPNTKYVATVTTYAAVYVTAGFHWYEHTNRGA